MENISEMSTGFKLQKKALDVALKYFNAGCDREIGVRNTMIDVFASIPWISTWEAGKLAERAWKAIEKQREVADANKR